MKTINSRWKDFASLVLPKGCSEVQAREMKRAFFAGWHDALCTLRNEVSELPEDDGVKQLESFNRECEGFAEAIKLGAA